MLPLLDAFLIARKWVVRGRGPSRNIEWGRSDLSRRQWEVERNWNLERRHQHLGRDDIWIRAETATPGCPPTATGVAARYAGFIRDISLSCRSQCSLASARAAISDGI